MKKISILLILLSSLLLSEESYENYQAQHLFNREDINAFFQSETGELLKKIVVDGNTYYMQQDGDLYDEDVATIDDVIFSARGNQYSFGRSKRLLAMQVYPSHQKAFYSNCDYKIKEKKLIPIHKTCGFHYRKNENRSKRIEWEHIVPAWHFGHQLRCWQNGGRMSCREHNTKFRQMEADMHNLVPAIGEINGDRSNFKYGMIEAEQHFYGKVKMKIDFSVKRAEPRQEVYGDIARIYFYMRDKYGLKISKAQQRMLIAWNNLDPVSEWEKRRNQLIKELQGDENIYVTNYQKIEQLGTPKVSITDFAEVKSELSESYSSFLSQFSAPVSGGILFLMTAFTIWYRKQKIKATTEEREVKPKEKEIATKSRGFMFLSKLGDVAMSINDKDEIIIERADKLNPNQVWVFTKANKKKEYFFIENPATGKVIEIAKADSNDGAKIILNKKRKTKNDHQEWKLESSEEKGYVFVMSKWSLNVLDVKYKKTKDGTKLQSFHKKVRGTENQKWKIERV